MASNKNALGKGLGALLESAKTDITSKPTNNSNQAGLISRINIENACRGLTIPHLAIHGSDDPTVLISDVYDFQKWNPNTIIHKIENANHVFGVSHPFNDKNFPAHFNEVLDKTFNFLKS